MASLHSDRIGVDVQAIAVSCVHMSRRRTTRSLALCAVVAIGLSAAGLTASLGQAAGKGRGGVKLNRIGRFDQPTFVTGAPGYPKLLFVTERGGTVRVVKRGHKRRRPFLNIRGLVGTGFLEQGLLSIAFPPDYRRSKRFYVFFTDNRGDIRVEEFRRRSPTRARRGSRRLVIEISHRANDNHNGGQL